MECIPAIDLHDGKAVRLVRGDFARATGYGDPVELALSYVDDGARRLHVVDLDAARTANPVHRETVASLVRNVPVPVQFGGGIRSLTAIDSLLSLGVERVILGTAVIEDDRFASDAAERFESRVLVGLDLRARATSEPRDSALAVRGWEHEADIGLPAMLARLADLPIGGVVVTNIDRDGTLEGPDLASIRFILARTAHDVYASGGVGSVRDLEALAALDADGRQLRGVVVGRAFVSGALSVKEAINACER